MGGIVGLLTIFALAAFVGVEVVSKVPSVLHTPLMSGSNAIHGIVLVGALLVMGEAHGPLQLALGFLAVLLATANVVGGFVVTDRMLEMFQSKAPKDRRDGSNLTLASPAGPADNAALQGAPASEGAPAPQGVDEPDDSDGGNLG
jgi:NAD(P) transhydrogenase subunit alpha